MVMHFQLTELNPSKSLNINSREYGYMRLNTARDIVLADLAIRDSLVGVTMHDDFQHVRNLMEGAAMNRRLKKLGTDIPPEKLE